MVAIVGRIGGIYRKEYEKNPVFTLFLTILLAFFIIYVVLAVITVGSTFYYSLYWDRNDMFMDHFNSMAQSLDHPYTKFFVIYPPLMTVFYAALGNITMPFVDVSAGTHTVAEMMRETQIGLMFLLMIIVLTFYALYLVFSKLIKEEGVRKELMFLLLVLLAYPFMYAVERGNSVLIALVFCFVFLLGYRSENKFIRYASYIALGCATGFKLYPVILLLLIIRDRNYKEAGICALIVAALLFIPFIFTDGNPLIFLDNVLSNTGSPNTYGFINFNQLAFGIVRDILGLSAGAAAVVSYAVIGVFTLLSFIVILFDKEMKFWKVVALISCNIILGLGIGTIYQIVYMLLPILYFLSAEKEMTKENKFYTICFAITMVLMPGIFHWIVNPAPIIGSIKAAFIMIIAGAILYEGIKRILRNRSERKRAEAPA